MIVFDLACVCGIIFEGWFHDRQDFICQQEAGLLVCPDCGSRRVRKILSPVRMRASAELCEQNSAGPENGPDESEVSAEKMVKALQVLQNYVEKNFEDVGTRLAEKALKIHYRVEKKRNIRGFATAEEEKTLENEGITLLKVPMPVKNDKLN